MSNSDTPQRYLRWRVAVGDGRYRRWPWWSLGAGRTLVPRPPDRPGAPGDGAYVNRLVVTAESVGWLRCLLDDPISLTRVRRVTVRVRAWRVPQRGWSGRLGPLPHLLAHRVRTPRRDRGQALVEVTLRWPVPLRDVLIAVLPVLTPLRPMPAPVSADVTARRVFPDWLGTRRNVTAMLGPLPDDPDIRPHDLVLTGTGAAPPLAVPQNSPSEPDQPPGGGVNPPDRPYYAAVVAAATRGAGPGDTVGAPDDIGPGDTAGRREDAGWAPGVVGETGPGPATVVVDLEHAVVRGRYGPFGPNAPGATLTFGAGPGTADWRIVDDAGELLCHGHLGRPRPAAHLASALAGIAVLRCPYLPAHAPLAEVALLADLVLAGVLVHAPQLPRAGAVHLCPEVVSLFTTALPGERADALDWEVLAVRQRRAVMRGHAAQFVLPKLSAGAFPGLAQPPSVSVLLVTKRLEHVAGVLAAIEAQTYPNLEIVLCTHGMELPAQLRDRITRCPRPVESVTLPAGQGFGEAIGAATARARGSLVTKFDDDDTYGPEHVWDLVLARHHSGATLVGKGAEFVYLQTLDTTVRRDPGAPEAYASLVAGGTMLIGRGDLEEVGGWRPVPRSIDRGLIDRVRRAGGLIYRTHPLGYVYHRHSNGHTWDPGLEYFLRGAGAQWPGLPRHAEFGTAEPSADQAPQPADRAPRPGQPLSVAPSPESAPANRR